MKFLKNKKQVFTVVTSVVCSVFLVAVGAYAATTIGNDVSVGGTLATGGTVTVGTAATGIDMGGTYTTPINIDGAVASGSYNSINIDLDMPFATIGDNYPAGILIDMQQTSDPGVGAWSAQGGMYGVNSRLHVANANTGAYSVLGRAYVTATGASDTVNDVVGIMGELRINGADTQGQVTSSFSAVRGSV